MKVALDTNILIDLWNGTPQGQQNAQALHQLRQAGDTLLICGAVHAELQAHPTFDSSQIDLLLSGMGVQVDWQMTEAIWRSAGQVHTAITGRRRQALTAAPSSGLTVSRRPLTDHLIGAHALHRADHLLTRNVRDFSDFAALELLTC